MKGLHRVKRRLADGSTRVHFYAWRGGPKIEAEPGTAAFHAEWLRLCAGRDAQLARDKISAAHHAGTFQQLINEYQSAPAFLTLKARTQADYAFYIRRIERQFGDMPLAALDDPRVRGEFLAWRDEVAAKTPRAADLGFAILSRICSWAYDRRRILQNPCERPGRVHHGARTDSVWTDGEIARLLAVASPPVALAVTLALWTGQRQGDVLGLSWEAYDGAALRLKQGKRGRHIVIPCAGPLKAALDAAKATRRAVTICATSNGTPWTSSGFRASFGKAKAAAKITGRTFHDFRGTAITLLGVAGCSVPEIATLTGHSLKTVEKVLDAHYLSRDQAMAYSAVAKLERAGIGNI